MIYYAPEFQGNIAALKTSIVAQIEYYFSVQNLLKDMYLRQLMDDQQFVSLADMAGFNRIARLTNDLQLIEQALRTSTVVEVIDGKVRKREGHAQFPRVIPAFDPSASAFVPTVPFAPYVPYTPYNLAAPEFVPSTRIDAPAPKPPTKPADTPANEPAKTADAVADKAVEASTLAVQPAPSPGADEWVEKTPSKKPVPKTSTKQAPKVLLAFLANTPVHT